MHRTLLWLSKWGGQTADPVEHFGPRSTHGTRSHGAFVLVAPPDAEPSPEAPPAGQSPSASQSAAAGKSPPVQLQHGGRKVLLCGPSGAQQQLLPDLSETDLSAQFDMLDRNSDGMIDRSEWMEQHLFGHEADWEPAGPKDAPAGVDTPKRGPRKGGDRAGSLSPERRRQQEWLDAQQLKSPDQPNPTQLTSPEQLTSAPLAAQMAVRTPPAAQMAVRTTPAAQMGSLTRRALPALPKDVKSTIADVALNVGSVAQVLHSAHPQCSKVVV